MKMIRLTFIGIMLICLIPTMGLTQPVFEDDFEDGTLDKWWVAGNPLWGTPYAGVNPISDTANSSALVGIIKDQPGGYDTRWGQLRADFEALSPTCVVDFYVLNTKSDNGLRVGNVTTVPGYKEFVYFWCRAAGEISYSEVGGHQAIPGTDTAEDHWHHVRIIFDTVNDTADLYLSPADDPILPDTPQGDDLPATNSCGGSISSIWFESYWDTTAIDSVKIAASVEDLTKPTLTPTMPAPPSGVDAWQMYK